MSLSIPKAAGQFLHAYTHPICNRFFFEIVQRKDNYVGFGRGNAGVRLEAMHEAYGSADDSANGARRRYRGVTGLWHYACTTFARLARPYDSRIEGMPLRPPDAPWRRGPDSILRWSSDG